MLTFFTTAKPFRDHSGVIQRNAVKSWRSLHPEIEVILFGDDAGAAEICEEFGFRHEPRVERNEFGSKRLDYMFERAQALARHDFLCYVNCDILLLADFLGAFQRVRSRHPRFLMVGRRWDTRVTEPIRFEEPGAVERLRLLALETGTPRGPDCVDFFLFPRGLYSQMPPLVIGRVWWDHWLVWQAGRLGADVVDVSSCVLAIHQNHDYSYHPAGASGVWTDEQARRNFELAGGRWHLHTIADAKYALESNRERRNWFSFWPPYWRVLRPYCAPFWFAFLGVTRPLRRLLGLRRRPRALPPAVIS
jgi:hypothetical protein